VDVEAKQMKKYPFELRSYNPYDPYCLVKDHYVRVQFNWIHGACHWVEEEPWRYCYSFSRPNDHVFFIVQWLVKQHEATSSRAPEQSTTIEENILVCDKGKRKIFDRMEEEKSCKFREDPLVEKVAMAIHENRQHRDKRTAQRKIEKELDELKEKL